MRKNVTTILYLTNSELFGRSTASSQYFLQLASYLGIPVIAWNADNSGLKRRVSQGKLVGLEGKAPDFFFQIIVVKSKFLVRFLEEKNDPKSISKLTDL